MNKTEKVVLVTGASSGIGKAAAALLAQKGWKVYAAARRLEAMQDLAAAGVVPLALDVTEERSRLAVVEKILRDEGRLDALVNNAGYGSYGALEDVSDAEARRQFDVNVFGLMALTRLALPHMRGQGSGRIVNVGSIGGRLATPMGGWYHATKFALEGLSDSLRLEVKPFGIEVVVIEPGGVATEWSGIAGRGLLAASSGGAYAKPARDMADGLEAIGRGKGPVSQVAPEVIAKVIVHALQTDRPKTRYAAPCHAKIILFLRWLLPDRAFDAMIMKQLAGLADSGAKRRCPTWRCGRREQTNESAPGGAASPLRQRRVK
ncbi:MAG: SDR family NAD(P)-dependent oxidoreductase [Desulfovibrionaceae bacterium]|nr:SDR family NAD(P)-dependent oxidoreductase [Desulfovibrionaceae bacterium]MBF0513488.1 SDR family NAD(P)-dependent oxidoreductase [Desulfovibrionaceae bacterium]